MITMALWMVKNSNLKDLNPLNQMIMNIVFFVGKGYQIIVIAGMRRKDILVIMNRQNNQIGFVKIALMNLNKDLVGK